MRLGGSRVAAATLIVLILTAAMVVRTVASAPHCRHVTVGDQIDSPMRNQPVIPLGVHHVVRGGARSHSGIGGLGMVTERLVEEGGITLTAMIVNGIIAAGYLMHLG